MNLRALILAVSFPVMALQDDMQICSYGALNQGNKLIKSDSIPIDKYNRESYSIKGF